MTRNIFTDDEPFSVAALNSMTNAHALEGVVEGLGLSPGAGDWDVDVAAGRAILGDEIVDVTADTVTHNPAGVEDRVDLITVDAVPSLSVTTGDEATVEQQYVLNPDTGDIEQVDQATVIAPDVPEGEALVGAVYVRGGSSEILGGDLYDYKTIVEEHPPELIQPQGEESGLDADTVRGFVPYGQGAAFGGVTQYDGTVGGSSEEEMDVFDVVGPGVILGGTLSRSTDSGEAWLEVDGGAPVDLTWGELNPRDFFVSSLPMYSFENSATLTIRDPSGVTTNYVTAHAWVLEL